MVLSWDLHNNEPKHFEPVCPHINIMYYRSYDDKVNPREKCIKDIKYIKVCMATKFLMMACWLTYSGNIISFLTFSSKKKQKPSLKVVNVNVLQWRIANLIAITQLLSFHKLFTNELCRILPNIWLNSTKSN